MLYPINERNRRIDLEGTIRGVLVYTGLSTLWDLKVTHRHGEQSRRPRAIICHSREQGPTNGAIGGKGPALALVEQIALKHLEQNSRPVAQPNPETHSDRVDSNRNRNGSMLVNARYNINDFLLLLLFALNCG